MADPNDELVDALADDGTVLRTVTRREIREGHLLHRVASVIVRNSAGEVYLHRRAEAKDIYPGAYDVWAGGVLAPGETPEEGAARELAEELGVESVVLEPLFVERFEAPRGRCVTHCYQANWDGPFRHQPEEVSWGGWVSIDELRERLADAASHEFPDDGRLFLERWLRDFA